MCTEKELTDENCSNTMWKSFYPDEVRKEQLYEGIYLFFILFMSLLLIFLTWKGYLCQLLSLESEQAITFQKYSYYASAGLLGGITFGIKFFYRVIARRIWERDRRAWRIMSPLVAMIIAFVIGAMIDASIMNTQKPVNGPAVVAMGFIAGYFADEAVSKMYEVATVIFGTNTLSKKDEADGKRIDV